MRLSSLTRTCLVLSGIVIAQSAGIAQEHDPFALDPADRASASLPMAYGLIISGAKPLYSASADVGDEPSDEFRFGVAAYVDAWQFGFERKAYGDVFQLALRTIGRDVYSAVLAEYGTRGVTDEITYFDNRGNRITKDTTRYADSYTVGFRYGSGLKQGLSMVYHMDLNLGVSNLDGDKSFLYFIGAAAGGRIPIGPTSLSLLAFGEYSAFGTSIVLGLSSSLALNLQAD